MEMQEKKALLEETAKEILEKMGFKANVFIAIDAMGENDLFSVEIQTDESGYLIGKHGANLSAFQHLFRIIIRKKTSEKIHFSVDVNNYRQDRKQEVVQIAREALKKLEDENLEEIALPPMNAFERRIVHLELENIGNVVTESVGSDLERKIIIKKQN